MSADATAHRSLLTPTASGRSSPIPRATRNAAEDSLHKKDKGYRRYAAGVERALALWDTAQQEWADYISFLGRLLKALQAHPAEFTIIPHSDTVALRLAQCLNPTLPSGVHQKALEVYGYVFAAIGSDALARDLGIYLPGLASVLSFASLTVRPLFLSVFEDHILKLEGDALRPALKAIILSLLPGLEDDTSEDFERMVSALDKLRNIVESGLEQTSSGSSHFWQCFFLATITNASRRQGALAFLIRRLPAFAVSKRRASNATQISTAVEGLSIEAEAAISPEPGLLIRCFESGLSDPQLLIQRGFLDLLVSHLPLDSPVLQQRVDKGDLERLVAAAAGVVARRDMSLNRRLWAWFLGPDPNTTDDGSAVSSPVQDKTHESVDPATHHAAFFSRYGLEALTSSVLKLINRQTKSPAERARPLRICLSFMDRWEVGGLIVPEIFLPALQSVQSYCETAGKEEFEEVLRSASAFFDGVDSGLIWGKLIQLATLSLNTQAVDRSEARRKIKLAKFVLARFNLKEEDMLVHHMPLMVLSTLSSLNSAFEKLHDHPLDVEVAEAAFEITDSLVQILPDRALRREHINTQPLPTTALVSRDILSLKLREFYEDFQGNLDAADPPFSPADLGQLALREAARLFAASLHSNEGAPAPEISARILGNLISKTQHLKALDETDPFALFRQVLAVPNENARPLPFSQVSAIVTVLAALETSLPSAPYIAISKLPDLIQPLLASLWQHFSPTRPKYHVEATRCLLQLHAILPESRIVEASVSSLIVRQLSYKQAGPETANCSQHFAVLWTHTMHELHTKSEKRASTTRRPSSSHSLRNPLLEAGEYHMILTRPLFLLLDTLVEDGTETAAFMRSWLQDLPSLNRVFDILAHHIQSLQCLATSTNLTPGQTRPKQRLARDDSKDCLYYMKHIFDILKRPSQFTWATLADSVAPITEDYPERMPLQEWLVRTCQLTLSLSSGSTDLGFQPHIHELHRTSVSIISQVYQSPFAAPIRNLELEVPLMARLRTAGPCLQSLLLGATLSALRLRLSRPQQEKPAELKPPSNPTHRSRLSLVINRDSEDDEPPPIPPPPQLVECLKFGFSAASSRLVLDDWVQFLREVLPLFADTIFQSLLPLVECLCKEISVCFEHLKTTFTTHTMTDVSPESSLITLINGLEQILAKAHDRLTIQETKASANKTPEQPQGFFSNVVSGVFTSENTQTRTPTANSRLTVLLCFQDTVRICFAIWSWGGYGPGHTLQDSTSTASFGYTSLRMRNRARRILEHLFAAEALECLETLAVLWTKASKDDTHEAAIMGLLNVLNGAKPKHTIPAMFNAVYSRTDPNALEVNLMSTLTSNLSEIELVAFLVEYIRSLEDDAMDEIWPDCTLFLRDVLANPLPHRQILPTLLEFTAVIGQKVDNTNFGEQRKMRRELADIFTRVLTAIFTTRSMGYKQDPNHTAVQDQASPVTNGIRAQKRATDVVTILTSIVPSLPLILVDNDRVTKVASDISTSVIGPSFRAKAFPDNVTEGSLDLLQGLMRIAQGNKLLKKDIYDAFNDSKFFNTELPLLRNSWLPILAQWTQSDKERVPELLARITTPTTAGIMFGVGATSARQEADRKTQWNLRRISLLILASPEDAYTPNIPQILEKVVELLAATPSTSPSSSTRADVLVLLRAMILKTSPVHLASLWPIINGELSASLSSLIPDASNKDHYNNAGVVQSCKLLDQLTVLNPDDFQLSEWLFICDTIDAVYKPSTPPLLLSLTDEVNDILSQHSSTPAPLPFHNEQPLEEARRTLFLDSLISALEKEENATVLDMTRGELINRVVRPFLGNLAMNVFEARYGGGGIDYGAIWASVVRDATL